jgi:N-acetylmuramoyl-L-alanine amidase
MAKVSINKFFHSPCIFILLLLLSMNGSFGAVLSKEGVVISSSSPSSTRVEIKIADNIDIRVVDEVQASDRFFIDLYNTSVDFPEQKFWIRDDILKAVEVRAYPDLKVTRIVFYPYNKTIFRVADGSSGTVYTVSAPSVKSFTPLNQRKTRLIVIDTSKYKHYPLPNLVPVAPPVPASTVASTGSSATDAYHPLPHRNTITKSGKKRLVILDPGHGGSSVGAVSQIPVNGSILREKTITLAVAHEVQLLLNKSPNVAAVMTRDGDDTIGLSERIEMAEKADGDLFVSVHANASIWHNSPDAKGIEFYYLDENKYPNTQKLIEAENAEGGDNLDNKSSAAWQMIYDNMVKDILDVNRSGGAQACEQISSNFSKDSYYRPINRGIKGGPFRVLMNRVMPSILIEVGFIDNNQEVLLLSDPTFQKRIARMIANGIMQYFAQQDPNFKFYQY